MKLSGSTFVWLAGIGLVWAIGSARGAESELWPKSARRFAASVRPTVTFPASDTVELPRGRSADYSRVAPVFLRPDRQRAQMIESARCPVERVRIGRTPELRRRGTVSLNRFVFRRAASDQADR